MLRCGFSPVCMIILPSEHCYCHSTEKGTVPSPLPQEFSLLMTRKDVTGGTQAALILCPPIASLKPRKQGTEARSSDAGASKPQLLLAGTSALDAWVRSGTVKPAGRRPRIWGAARLHSHASRQHITGPRGSLRPHCPPRSERARPAVTPACTRRPRRTALTRSASGSSAARIGFRFPVLRGSASGFRRVVESLRVVGGGTRPERPASAAGPPQRGTFCISA